MIQSKEEIQGIVKETVRETLISLGVDVSNPIEIQRDLQWVRGARQGLDDLKKKGAITVVGILAAGVLGATWVGIRAMVGK